MQISENHVRTAVKSVLKDEFHRINCTSCIYKDTPLGGAGQDSQICRECIKRPGCAQWSVSNKKVADIADAVVEKLKGMSV